MPSCPSSGRRLPDDGAGGGARGPSDEGYALAEMVVAGTLMLCLSLPAYAVLRRTLDVADLLQTRFAQNAQARQVAALLADGNSKSTGVVVNPRGQAMVEGLHSRRSAVASDLPAGSGLRSTNQVRLPDGAVLYVQGDATAPISVACFGVDNPLPDCTGTETLTVQGWLSSDPVVTTTGPGGTVAAVTATLTSPYRAARARTAAAGAAVPTEAYRMMFNLNVETAGGG